MAEPLLEELHTARARAERDAGREALLQRFEAGVASLRHQVADHAVPARTRERIRAFLESVQAQHAELGSRCFEPAYLLNVIGEAMVRSGLVHREIVESLQVGLYFFGLDQIERRWSSQAAVYSGLHADLLMEYLGRRRLKEMMAEGRRRLEEGRVFCLTYHYLNSLRKAYWNHCRGSRDALDVAVTGEGLPNLQDPVSSAAGTPGQVGMDPEDRVGIMLEVFSRSLTPRQQWIYMAKNRSILEEAGAEEGGTPDIDRLLRRLGEDPPEGNLGWGEIARRKGINEKTAKREYLRALDILLRRSGEAVFGDSWTPSGYVKRVLEQIRKVVDEKDLRIRRSTGRGLGTLVQKWEVALRFVLNHQRVSA